MLNKNIENGKKEIFLLLKKYSNTIINNKNEHENNKTIPPNRLIELIKQSIKFQIFLNNNFLNYNENINLLNYNDNNNNNDNKIDDNKNYTIEDNNYPSLNLNDLKNFSLLNNYEKLIIPNNINKIFKKEHKNNIKCIGNIIFSFIILLIYI
jgi:hypothetical protein